MNKSSYKSLAVNLNNHHEPLAFQILFADIYSLSEKKLTEALYIHPLVSDDFRVDIASDQEINGITQGLLGWGEHVIQLTCIDETMSEDILAYSLQVAHCDQAIKEQTRKHKSHILLRYAGYDVSPYVQYDSLAIAAGVFADHGALMVLNLRATSCLPIDVLSPKKNTSDKLEQVIYTLLPSILYCGFIKHFIENEDSLWVRTIGADALYLPDFAAFLSNVEASEEYFMIFTEIHHYIHNNNIQLDVGHVMEVGAGKYVRLRAPNTDEFFLDSEGSMLVLEPCLEAEYKGILVKDEILQ